MLLMDGSNECIIAQMRKKVDEENERYIGINCSEQTLIMCEHENVA